MKPKPEPHPLWAELRANPDDTLKLALADYLEENGDPNTAYALRWCIAHDRWPRVTKSLLIWITDPSERHMGKKREVAQALLPIAFFVIAGEYETCAQLRSMSTGHGFDTLASAIGQLGDILATLRRSIGLDKTQEVSKSPN